MKKPIIFLFLSVSLFGCDSGGSSDTVSPSTPSVNSTYNIDVDVSDSASDKDCEIGKTFRCRVSNSSANYTQSKNFNFEQQTFATLTFDKIEKGGIYYTIDIIETTGGTETIRKTTSDYFTSKEVENDQIPDKTITLYQQDICN